MGRGGSPGPRPAVGNVVSNILGVFETERCSSSFDFRAGEIPGSAREVSSNPGVAGALREIFHQAHNSLTRVAVILTA